MSNMVTLLRTASTSAIAQVNDFNQKVFRTRGGRLGSGMGLLLEGLWGYETNRILVDAQIEVAWLVDHEYNDFAVVDVNSKWNPSTKEGEYFRVEIKSMNVGAEESKAHFDELWKNIGEEDQLVVLAWRWEEDGERVWPKVVDLYIGNARSVARLRDVMHQARGGTFVDGKKCPDGCSPSKCQHDGEPLNANGKRERVFGPEATRVSQKVSHAQNFGGLVRMVKARGADALSSLKLARSESEDAALYLDFIQRLRVSE